MRAVNKYLMAAARAIESTRIAKDGKIEKAYKGAVSSFGASLVMSGLIPTIQFFMADTDRDADHKIIMEAIARTVYQNGQTDAASLKKKIMDLYNERNYTTSRVGITKMKMQILDAAVALKIMMRSYTFTDGTEMDETP